MTYRYALERWLAPAGLVLAMTGCPGGDDSDTGATTLPQPTTGPAATSTGEDSGSGNPMTTMPMESSGNVDSSGGVTCDPPCEAGQECIGGTCFDMGESGNTTGEPPAECGLAVMLNFPNPMCGPCAEGACCPELQGCFGDETTMKETECLQLNNCIAMNCMMAMTLMEVQECVDMNCMEFAASMNTWLAYQACLGMNCAAECS
jgi:hypothetical protein